MAQGKRARPGEVFGFTGSATRKEGVEHEYAVFKVRTLQEIEHLGAMIETVFQNAETFELSEDDKRQHHAALQVLYWVRSNPDIPDYTKEFRKQQEQFDAIRSFDLEVGDKLYRVIPGQRVQRLNKQTKAVERYFCIHTAYDHPVPPEDTALAQKLLLEADEAQFLRIANESAA